MCDYSFQLCNYAWLPSTAEGNSPSVISELLAVFIPALNRSAFCFSLLPGICYSTKCGNSNSDGNRTKEIPTDPTKNFPKITTSEKEIRSLFHDLPTVEGRPVPSWMVRDIIFFVLVCVCAHFLPSIGTVLPTNGRKSIEGGGPANTNKDT